MCRISCTILSSFTKEFEAAGVRLVATTHQSDSEIKAFLESDCWAGELYRDAAASTYRAVGVTMDSAGGCWPFFKKAWSGLTSGSEAYQAATAAAFKSGNGNLKGSGLKSSAMVIVPTATPAVAPLYVRRWAEEPAIGDIFGVLGADESRQQELQTRADEEMKKLASQRAAESKQAADGEKQVRVKRVISSV